MSSWCSGSPRRCAPTTATRAGPPRPGWGEGHGRVGNGCRGRAERSTHGGVDAGGDVGDERIGRGGPDHGHAGRQAIGAGRARHRDRAEVEQIDEVGEPRQPGVHPDRVGVRPRATVGNRGTVGTTSTSTSRTPRRRRAAAQRDRACGREHVGAGRLPHRRGRCRRRRDRRRRDARRRRRRRRRAEPRPRVRTAARRRRRTGVMSTSEPRGRDRGRRRARACRGTTCAIAGSHSVSITAGATQPTAGSVAAGPAPRGHGARPRVVRRRTRRSRPARGRRRRR